MGALVKKARIFLHNEAGPTFAEYAVFLAMIVFAYWAFTKLMGH